MVERVVLSYVLLRVLLIDQHVDKVLLVAVVLLRDSRHAVHGVRVLEAEARRRDDHRLEQLRHLEEEVLEHRAVILDLDHKLQDALGQVVLRLADLDGRRRLPELSRIGHWLVRAAQRWMVGARSVEAQQARTMELHGAQEQHEANQFALVRFGCKCRAFLSGSKDFVNLGGSKRGGSGE